MRLWRILCTLISALRQMDTLLGKEIASRNGAVLGVIIDLKLDLVLGKTLLVVQNGEWLSMVPSEQVTGQLSDRQLLFEGPLSA